MISTLSQLDPKEGAWVEIDEMALVENVCQIRHLLSPGTELMAIVKANAYGHGTVPVARRVLEAGATWLGIATIREGIELRQAGIKAPILLLGATNTPQQIEAITTWQLQPTLCTPTEAVIASKALQSLGQSLPVHLNLDTGMSRRGAPWQEAVAFVQEVQELPNLKIASIYSHLAAADSPDLRLLQQQKQRFDWVIHQLQALGLPCPCFHLANSAATLQDPNLHYDLVRVGLGIYGVYSAPHLRSLALLKPVLQVKARVTQVKNISPGTGVSYGHLFTAQRPTRLATIGIGYADGVPRDLSNQMAVIVQGRKLPQVGAITMDQFMVDATDLPDLKVGEVATLIGQEGKLQISAQDWTEMLGTVPWEVLCGIGHRLPRIGLKN
jgi:alanine racemase